MIPDSVKRFWKPDSYFGYADRSVPVVLLRHSDAADLRQFAILIEEYIAERFDWRVVDDLLVLNDDLDLEYSEQLGVEIPEKYDVEFTGREDDLPVFSFGSYERWVEGAPESQFDRVFVAERLRNPKASSETLGGCISFTWEGTKLVTNYFESEPSRSGIYHLVHHAETKRLILLIPDLMDASSYMDMQAARKVTAYFGLDPQYGSKLWMLVFDDDTESPYVLRTAAALAGADKDYEDWTFEVLRSNGESWSRPLKIRCRSPLPRTF